MNDAWIHFIFVLLTINIARCQLYHDHFVAYIQLYCLLIIKDIVLMSLILQFIYKH